MTDKTETPPTNDGEQKTKPSREQIVTELENIFSKEFLSTNPILVSNMKGDNQIPINLLADLPAIKQLSVEASDILEALRSSSKIVVDNDGLFARPVGKLVERNTIILRDVVPETKPEDVRALFNNQERFLSAILELKPELANTYFIKFNGEDVTLEAWTHLREQNLNGKPVQARVKSENIIKSFYYTPKPETTPQQSGASAPVRSEQSQGYWSYEQQYQDYVPGEQPFVRGGSDNRRGRGGRGEGRGDGGGRRRKDFRGNNSYDESRGRGRRGLRDKRSPTKTPPKTEAKKPIPTNNNPLPVYWPPLPTSNQSNSKPGYHISLKKYPPETITSIISGIKEEIKTKFDNQCSAIMENGFNSALEITKPIPPNLQVDWIPPKNKSRKSSVSRPKKASFSKKSDFEPQPNAWPAVNNSNVRHPPNNQQAKGGKAKQPLIKKQNQNKPTPTPQDQPNQPTSDSPASESQVQQTPQQNSNQTSSSNLNPASPSYADITKSVKNEAN